MYCEVQIWIKTAKCLHHSLNGMTCKFDPPRSVPTTQSASSTHHAQWPLLSQQVRPTTLSTHNSVSKFDSPRSVPTTQSASSTHHGQCPLLSQQVRPTTLSAHNSVSKFDPPRSVPTTQSASSTYHAQCPLLSNVFSLRLPLDNSCFTQRGYFRS